MKHLFFGGIHPKYNKEMSTGVTDFQTIAPAQPARASTMAQHRKIAISFFILCPPLCDVPFLFSESAIR